MKGTKIKDTIITVVILKFDTALEGVDKRKGRYTCTAPLIKTARQMHEFDGEFENFWFSERFDSLKKQVDQIDIRESKVD